MSAFRPKLCSWWPTNRRCPTAFFMSPLLTYFLFNKKSLFFVAPLEQVGTVGQFRWSVGKFGRSVWPVRVGVCRLSSRKSHFQTFPKPYLLVMRFSLAHCLSLSLSLSLAFRRYLSSALGQCIRLRCAIAICLPRILITHLAVSRRLERSRRPPYSKGCYYLATQAHTRRSAKEDLKNSITVIQWMWTL